jgi:hypothetical protein
MQAATRPKAREKEDRAMTVRISLLVALLCVAGHPVVAAGAQESKEPGFQKQLEAQREQERTLVHKMMGHINLAAVALDTSLPDAAREHLERASALAAQIDEVAPQLQSKTQFKYGKVSYEFEDHAKNYYVPIIDDLFLLSDYKSTFHAWKSRTDIDETDAGVVLVTVRADIREIEKGLQEAEKKLDAKEFAAAGEALNDIYEDAIVDETEITDPLWAVHDNLALAQNLLREENYDSARFALRHARKELGKLKKERPADTESIQKLDASIAKVEGELEQKDPSLTQRIDRTVASWMTTVRSWF